MDLLLRRAPTALKRLGAKVQIAPLGSHASIQNLANAPSPRITETDALNANPATYSIEDGNTAQANVAFVRHSHSQRNLSVKPMILRFVAKPSVLPGAAYDRPRDITFAAHRELWCHSTRTPDHACRFG